jgi:TonB family protein
MIKILMTSLLLQLFTLTLICQDNVDRQYYKGIFDKRSVKEKKAEVIKLTTRVSDSITRFEYRDIRNNKLLVSGSFNYTDPYGIWKFFENETGSYFDLEYNPEEYTYALRIDLYKGLPIGDYQGDFVPPIFTGTDDNFQSYIAYNLKYPEIAVKKKKEGRIVSQFIIDENGELQDFSIISSVFPCLDKEAARVILSAPKWIPAKIDGKPIKVHVIQKTVFILQ